LTYWPIHRRGGLLKIISDPFKVRRVQASHLIIGGFAVVILGLMVILAGLVWQFWTPRSVGVAGDTVTPPQSSLPPLPKGATMRIGSEVFWVVTQQYTPKEASEILDELEDLDNVLQGKVAPVVAKASELSIAIESNAVMPKGSALGGPQDTR
jgi:hypothetical protein